MCPTVFFENFKNIKFILNYFKFYDNRPVLGI